MFPFVGLVPFSLLFLLLAALLRSFRFILLFFSFELRRIVIIRRVGFFWIVCVPLVFPFLSFVSQASIWSTIRGGSSSSPLVSGGAVMRCFLFFSLSFFFCSCVFFLASFWVRIRGESSSPAVRWDRLVSLILHSPSAPTWRRPDLDQWIRPPVPDFVLLSSRQKGGGARRGGQRGAIENTEWKKEKRVKEEEKRGKFVSLYASIPLPLSLHGYLSVSVLILSLLLLLRSIF